MTDPPKTFVLATAVTLASIALTLVPLGRATAAAATLPPHFQDEQVIGGFDHPTAVEFSPDGRVFVAEQSGVIEVFDSLTDTTPTTFADLRTNVHNFWDRGLLGLALHPDFPTTPYVYVMYAYDYEPGFTGPQPPRWGTPGSTGDGCDDPPGATADGCVVTGRLSRLQASGNTMVPGSETPLVEDWCQQFPSHTVGSVVFGPDGALYASGGDGANFGVVDYGQFGDPPNPCGDPPTGRGGDQDGPNDDQASLAEGGALRSQDLRTTGNPEDPAGLDGTIIRIDPITGNALPSNPLAGSSDPNARRIVSYGFRNPFRFTFRPGTSELWLGDVGWNDVEEINRIPSPTSGVTNFGWPCYEGTGHQSGYDAAAFDLCEDLYGETGAVAAPHFAYDHHELVVPGETCPYDAGSSVSGLAFYGDGTYPPAYDGALFFSDYSRDCIWVMFPGTDGVPNESSIDTFVAGAANPVEIQIGPGGDLFYVDYGQQGGAFPGTIRRIKFSGHAPTAVATADPTEGPAPLTVEFDGSTSSDPDQGDTLTFDWDLDGDGSFDDGSGPTITEDYAAGTYSVRLRVTDGDGLTDLSEPIIIRAGAPPTAAIQTPIDGTTWVVDDDISFTGTATDTEPGPVTKAWDLTLHHCPSACHPHGLQTWGNVAGGSFSAPDHEYPSYLQLTLTATDADGLTDTTSVFLDPETVDLTFESDPTGLNLTVGSTAETTPFTRRVIVGSKNTISAPSPQPHQGSTWEWVSWSDGGTASHFITAPDTPATYTAVYRPASAAAPNAAPSATIDTPSPTATWAVGEPVAFSGHATDLQEGELPASSLAWRLMLHDCGSCPAQSIQTWPGAKDGSFIPPPAGPDAYLELELSATDSQGSVGSTTRRLDPQLVRVAVATKPAGLHARVVSAPQEVAAARSVIAGTEVKVRAPKRQRAEGMKFRFRGWSDGGSRIHDVVVGPGTPLLVAKYRCVPGPGETRKDCKAAIADLKPDGRQPS